MGKKSAECLRPSVSIFGCFLDKGIKIKGPIYHMTLKPGVQGIVRPARKVAVALQEKVKKELQHMEKEGVVNRVKGPTE